MSLHTALARLLRDMPDAKLAEMMRDLPDEDLAQIGADALAAETAARPVRRAARAAAKPTAKPRAERTGRASPSADAVFKVIAGADDPVSKSQIVEATGLTANQVGGALMRLKQEGRAFTAGRTTGARWALTQEAADEAVA